MAERRLEMVTPDQIRTAVALLEQRRSLGQLTEAEVVRRINDCRRAVTPRDLWKASGGLAGDRRRQDWWDIRRTVAALLFIAVLAAFGMWLVTWTMGLVEGSGETPVIPVSMVLGAAPPSR